MTGYGIVGMRVEARTRSSDQLHRFVEGLGLPVLGYVRDTQNYVHLAAQGLTLFDVTPGRVQRDLQQWEPITRWLDEPARPQMGKGKGASDPNAWY